MKVLNLRSIQNLHFNLRRVGRVWLNAPDLYPGVGDKAPTEGSNPSPAAKHIAGIIGSENRIMGHYAFKTIETKTHIVAHNVKLFLLRSHYESTKC